MERFKLEILWHLGEPCFVGEVSSSEDLADILDLNLDSNIDICCGCSNSESICEYCPVQEQYVLFKMKYYSKYLEIWQQ